MKVYSNRMKLGCTLKCIVLGSKLGKKQKCIVFGLK